MSLRITLHARRRMAEYGISERAVRDAVARPDSEVAWDAGRIIAQKRQDGKLLRVTLRGG
ncbi:MAG: DUF4258 domain-containing protein [Candidatus Nanohaloarchaea archaeon]|nr:DUF4258 domain-containing protein [Candidatus Nanohaloarchaea archaeon]